MSTVHVIARGFVASNVSRILPSAEAGPIPSCSEISASKLRPLPDSDRAGYGLKTDSPRRRALLNHCLIPYRRFLQYPRRIDHICGNHGFQCYGALRRHQEWRSSQKPSPHFSEAAAPGVWWQASYAVSAGFEPLRGRIHPPKQGRQLRIRTTEEIADTLSRDAPRIVQTLLIKVAIENFSQLVDCFWGEANRLALFPGHFCVQLIRKCRSVSNSRLDYGQSSTCTPSPCDQSLYRVASPQGA